MCISALPCLASGTLGREPHGVNGAPAVSERTMWPYFIPWYRYTRYHFVEALRLAGHGRDKHDLLLLLLLLLL